MQPTESSSLGHILCYSRTSKPLFQPFICSPKFPQNLHSSLLLWEKHPKLHLPSLLVLKTQATICVS